MLRFLPRIYSAVERTGFLKEELFVDFSLATSTDVIETLNTYVEYFDNRRPAAALQYKSPVQYKIEQGFG